MSSLNSVLITGGSGYVGSILVNNLVKENYDVRVVDSLVYGNDGISKLVDEKKIKFFNLDIRETKNLTNIISNVDCVIRMFFSLFPSLFLLFLSFILISI